ncbi:MAG: peptidylprolyl isomerase [Pseudomonadota bacterium]
MTENQIIARMNTNKGTINITLYADKVPLTVASFVNLAKRGFYDDLSFHRVINDFMVQGGCPLGTGTGEPGYRFEDEFNRELIHNRPGILSMANAGPRTNGSQFFITHVPCPWLDGKHAVFGSVVGDEDMKVVNSIVQGDRINSITIDGDTTALYEKMQDRIDQWNKALDLNHPHLKKA